MLEVILKAPKMEKDCFEVGMVIPRYQILIEGVNEDYLLKPLKIMYDSCRHLKPYQLRFLRRAVYCNNKIEDLCEGKLQPVHYSELENILGAENEKLLAAIKIFCYELYNSCLKRKVFIDEYEDIKDYYNHLVKRNSNCVMCGQTDAIDTELDDTMSAFDHYLPRALYPFNSVNMNNLVPTCDKCNMKYKGATDPLFKVRVPPYKRKEQLRCFYPFSIVSYSIVVCVKFLLPYHKNMPKDKIEVKVSCGKDQDKVANWNRIYGIEKRYIALVGNDNYYDFYVEQLKMKVDTGWSMEKIIHLRENNMGGDMNFLKVPFLKAVLESMKL